MNIKLNHIAALLLACFGITAANGAKNIPTDAVKVVSQDVSRSDDNFFVKLTLDLSGYKGLNHNRDITITPVLAGENDTVRFTPIMVAGRARYYLHLRERDKSRPVKTLYRAGGAKVVEYSASTHFEPWMDLSNLSLEAQSCGCCGEPVALADVPVRVIDFTPKEVPVFKPQFVFVTPEAEREKWRELSGQAFIDFPVNIMTINPDYRNNPRELAKIIETIDKVKNDKDITIKGLSIRGYASPEGSYSNNERLAKGRTAALKNFVQDLYSFPKDFIDTSYDPEDWGGLRKYVEESGIANKEAILALINTKMDPDAKDRKLKRDFPEQYKYLLANVYPALRHSDYTVSYIVRTFTDPVEILEIMKTAPGKLSQEELFVAANSLEPGSDEYNEVFEVAARLFPDDKFSNLNAANAAMGRKDFKAAEKYLLKAGDSAQAEYARGVLKALEGDYESAENFFNAAKSLPEANDALEQIAILKNQP